MNNLIAWIGEDELGSGEVGIKMIGIPGYIDPLALIDTQLDAKSKLDDPAVLNHLQLQANIYGKTLRLVRFVEAEELKRIEPMRH